ncbi:hypothetical protein [Fusobacterium hominis]|uniref:Uncharacterized protein n=1 Tax=Fusobacterium hominis TaxID=2764326 RepID=A0A7G9GUT4_9FUSO|nr:hypothetical protein [Fusobacterium hominis]QNM14566.1 hypothetical protein H9Q81_06135 [Fusobacterium hominis]
MNFNFDVPYETELLREKTSKVLKEFDSYIKRHNITNEKDSIVILRESIVAIRSNIFKCAYTNSDSIKKARREVEVAT